LTGGNQRTIACTPAPEDRHTEHSPNRAYSRTDANGKRVGVSALGRVDVCWQLNGVACIESIEYSKVSLTIRSLAPSPTHLRPVGPKKALAFRAVPLEGRGA
jgi:hypothetical protein